VRQWWHTGLLVNAANEKLSKSAANATSVRAWLAGGGRADGGADGGGGGGGGGTPEERADAFRLFCVAHRWDAPAAWADARAVEGLTLLRRLRSFLVAASGAAAGGAPAAAGGAPPPATPPAPDTCTSADAVRVTAATAAAAAAVGERLAASFDTRGALDALVRLEGVARAAARRADAAVAAGAVAVDAPEPHAAAVTTAAAAAASLPTVAVGGGDGGRGAAPRYPPVSLDSVGGVRLAVAGAAALVADTMDLFGLNRRWTPGGGGGAGGGDAAAIDTLVAFRGAVRAAARSALAARRRGGGGGGGGGGAGGGEGDLAAELLRLCDGLREEGLRRRLGVVVRDEGEGGGSWTRT